MAISTATLTFDVADMLGNDFDARRIKAWITTNVADDTIVNTAGNKVRLGSGAVEVNSDGTGSATVWVPGVNANPSSWQTTLHVDYPDRFQGNKRTQRHFGPFTITTSADLADLIPEQEVPAEYLTTVTTTLQGYLDDGEEFADAAAASAVEAAGQVNAAALQVSYANLARAGAEEAEAAAEALVLSDLGTTDGQTRALIENDESQVAGALRGTIAVSAGASPSLLGAVQVAEQGSNPKVIDAFDGYVWGATDTHVHRSSDAGRTWTQITAAKTTSMRRLVPTSDGEVIAFHAQGVYRSTGWGTGTVTWSTDKISVTGSARVQFWSADGDGTKFICAEYSATRADSVKGWISVDGGVTFVERWNSITQHGAISANQTHIHGCCYDPWNDTFYISEGHNNVGGIYHSTDDGVTWTRAAGMVLDPSPTVLVATDDGLCCGSDREPNGLYGVIRQPDPADQQLVLTARWQTGRAGLVGFAQRGYRDPRTGLVYIGFLTNFGGAPPIIGAGNASSAAVVWTWAEATGSGDKIDNLVIDRGTLVASARSGTERIIRSVLPRPGNVYVDQGNNRGGIVGEDTSVAVGAGARAPVNPAGEGVALGVKSYSGGQQSIALGYLANIADGDNFATAIGWSATAKAQGVALGHGASVTASFGTALGKGATAANTATAIGHSASATGTTSTAIGGSAQADFTNATAIGKSAVAGASGAIAIGQGSTVAAGHTNSIALGKDVTTTDVTQIKVGTRHMEMTRFTTHPAAPPANQARLYTYLNGSGKLQLAVRFPTGAVQYVATEP